MPIGKRRENNIRCLIMPSYRPHFFMLLVLWIGANPLGAEPKAEKGALAMKQEIAIFAGGCFWCMQPPFDNTPGVIKTVVGYCGGTEKNPTYEQVSSGTTGHTEAIEVTFDPTKVTYEKLLEVFWRNIDPTSKDGQFVDRGRQYRSAIFYLHDAQKTAALASKVKLEQEKIFSQPIVTEIVPATTFYPETTDYHQMYYKKNPIRYKFYRFNSGRDQFLEKTWGKKK